MMKLWVKTLGCKVNQADTAEVIEKLMPVQVVHEPSGATAGLLNTCTVTHKADRDARKLLGSLQRDWPSLPIVVGGCATMTMAEELVRFSNVRAIVPPGDSRRLAAAITALQPADSMTPDPALPARRNTTIDRNRAFLKIQDGCDSRCTYCVVPLVRGRERSLATEQVHHAFEQMILKGFQEIVLVGIHLGRYGYQPGKRSKLPELIVDLTAHARQCAWQGRLRLSSIEPKEFSTELLDALAECKLVCPHFHVPLQSGSDSMLARMGRLYSVSEYTNVVRTIVKRFPAAAIGTDVIVGFPGESRQDSEQTLAMLQELPVAYLHVFMFSPRPGTPAALQTPPVNPQTAKERSAALRQFGRARWREFTARGIGCNHSILTERSCNGGWEGRSEAYRRVWLKATSDRCILPGGLVSVRGIGINGDRLVAVPVFSGQGAGE